jgi:hypothetical protein
VHSYFRNKQAVAKVVDDVFTFYCGLGAVGFLVVLCFSVAVV